MTLAIRLRSNSGRVVMWTFSTFEPNRWGHHGQTMGDTLWAVRLLEFVLVCWNLVHFQQRTRYKEECLKTTQTSSEVLCSACGAGRREEFLMLDPRPSNFSSTKFEPEIVWKYIAEWKVPVRSTLIRFSGLSLSNVICPCVCGKSEPNQRSKVSLTP